MVHLNSLSPWTVAYNCSSVVAWRMYQVDCIWYCRYQSNMGSFLAKTTPNRHLSERLVSRRHEDPNEDCSETPQTSQHCGVESYIRGSKLGLHYAETWQSLTADVRFSSRVLARITTVFIVCIYVYVCILCMHAGTHTVIISSWIAMLLYLQFFRGVLHTCINNRIGVYNIISDHVTMSFLDG